MYKGARTPPNPSPFTQPFTQPFTLSLNLPKKYLM